jgi:hypothetical protein
MDANKPTFEPGALTIYTDGSKTTDGVGAGVYCDKPKINLSASLRNISSVFLAQTYAIELGIRELIYRKFRSRHIYILSDSRAALLALKSYEIKSKL